MTEEEVRQELEENERTMINRVCDTICNYRINVNVYISDFVATICNIEKERIFSNSNDHDVAQARALFWYAYRYMTGETYKQIGKMSKDVYGKSFSSIGVATGVYKMHQLIEEQPIWRKRWTIVKHIIKTQNDLMFERPVPITITIPKNVELKVKKE